MLAALAMMLSGCSEVQTDELALPRQDAAESGVTFDAYTQRGIDTRSGYAGPLTTSEGTDNLQTEGFGVFAYYTDNGEYSQRSTPNFMYNQKVAYNSVAGVWDYTPVKYWPNEYGTDAGSADMDKLSFFAYAPFVSAAPVTGRVDDATYGITGFTRNTDPGDPCVRYIASFDAAKSVDLCWGGVGTVADGTWPVVQDNGVRQFAAGLPWINVERPASATGQRLKFLFKHALSQLNVQIDADPDIVVPNETTQIGTLPDGSTVETGGTKTKVYVRSISFGGFAMKGMLNLNNQVSGLPRWLDYDFADKGIEGATVTIHDGLRDGREGTGATSTNETVTGLNPALISDNGNTTAGVTHELKNLFASSSLTDPVYVIPTGDDLTVSITYDVETASENLAGYLSDGVTHGYSAENTITKTVALSSGGALALAAGRKYTVKLHLGMNSLKFDASVGDWEVKGSGWLPVSDNPLSLSLGSAHNMSISAAAQSLTATTEATTLTGTNSDNGVITISTAPVSPTRTRGMSQMRAGTRAVQTIENTEAKTIYITPVAVGTATITCTDSEGNTARTVVTVSRAAQTVTLSESELNISGAAGTTGSFTVNRQGDGVITATSSNPSVATTSVNQSTGEVTVTSVASGSATITVTVAESTTHEAYTASDKTVAVTVVSDPGVALSASTVGMIVASNGKAYTTENYSSTYGPKVAVVGYNDGSTGYAIALKDASNQTWDEITNSGTNKDVDCVLDDDKRGNVPVAPTGTTWKVLNKANYEKVFIAMGSTLSDEDGTTYDATVNDKITAAGGDALSNFYWSSSDYNDDGWGFSDQWWSSSPDGFGSYKVRPVLVW